ncbi:MAG TPA: mandelate racemase/muconate lactonizing enzyme family protein [Methylomirabilota bacterium]|nr:mandelate racemase/muconate lactonizing enzyme family protein [Methylomirabilota bacterium]
MALAAPEVGHYRIPLPRILSDATHGDITHFELVTVRLRARDGAEGTGYTYTVGAGGAAIRALLARDLAPVLTGQDEERIADLWQRMWWRLHYVGRGGLAAFAISAVDIALWDLRARRQRMPLWRLLGGHDPRVKAYAGGIDLQFPLDQLQRQTEENLGRGFRAIKMKVGRDRLQEDLARVRALRELLGPDTPLMVDANMRWTADQAIRASRALAEHDVFWLEEPTTPDDLPGHVRIVREGALPVAAGENLRTLSEFERLIDAGGVSFPEPDVSNCGGISVWLRVAHVAEARHLPVTSHGVHDLHVHLLAAVPNASYLEVHGFGLERFIAHPLELVDGEAVAPERPGHGVEFDWKALETLPAPA